MTHNKPTQFDLDLQHGPAVIRALSSLSSSHVEAMTAVAGDLWAVQIANDYDGYLSIIVEPTDPTSDRPSYLISGTVQQIELAEVRNEALTTLLAATEIDAIASELARRLQS